MEGLFESQFESQKTERHGFVQNGRVARIGCWRGAGKCFAQVGLLQCDEVLGILGIAPLLGALSLS